MIVPDTEIVAILRQMNPWWQGIQAPDLPKWRRAAFGELFDWLSEPPAPRAVLLSGARQTGKTTLFLQVAEALIKDGVHPSNVLYVSFDHPVLKLVGLDHVLRLWRSTEPPQEGFEYLFIDEIQFLSEWQTRIKLQIDLAKKRRVALTGSATPIAEKGQESGVGRWYTIRLATLSFYEFLRIRETPAPELPEIQSLRQLFEWSEADYSRVAAQAEPLEGQFHEYLQRGGFPQCALAPTVTWAQRLLREDIVDKVLKRDMTALFGVRRVLELEHTFLYLCLHGGELLDVQTLCNNLDVKKPTALNFISLLEATHLVHKLSPLGYGKEVLRGRHKIYLADAAIGPSVLLKGKALLEDTAMLGKAVETAFFKHVFTRYYDRSINFAYWRGKKGHEVDIIADSGERLIPFEVKYRNNKTGINELKGLSEFCFTKQVSHGYVITKKLEDFGKLHPTSSSSPFELLKIPAVLACYWLGRSELEPAQDV